MDRLPRVSICIPVYNGSRYLTEAIRSTLTQDFDDFELLLVDDCSNDGSDEIARSFSDPRLKFHRNRERLGLVNNWNQCLALARGEYVGIFHQDDVMLPGNIATKVSILDQHPAVGLVFSHAEMIDGDGRKLSTSAERQLPDGVQSGEDFFQDYFLQPNVICCPSVIARKVCYEQLGGFDARLSYACDWEMWLRICLNFDVAYISQALIKYREHDANESRKFHSHLSTLKENFLSRILLLEKFPQRIARSKELQVELERDYSQQALELANHHYSHGRYTTASALLKFAAKAYKPVVTEERFMRLSAKLLLGERGTRLAMRAKRALQSQ
jgi:glycosyltransferase involved in cell wall biosynthesis